MNPIGQNTPVIYLHLEGTSNNRAQGFGWLKNGDIDLGFFFQAKIK